MFLTQVATILLVGIAQTPSRYTISTIAGSNVKGSTGDGGAATSAQLAGPSGIAITSGGILYIADQFNHKIRQVSNGTISAIAGTGTAGFSGDNAAATAALMNGPSMVAVDSSNNIYVADTTNQVVRKIVSGGNITPFAGANSAGGGFGGDNAAATSASLNKPVGLAVDSSGNVFIADSGNNRIRKVATGGTITTVAGNGLVGSFGDGGLATNARLNNPLGIAVDRAGNLYIADTSNHRIRKVNTAGVITTIAGTGTPGYAGDMGRAVEAGLFYPEGIAVDADGNVYFADSFSSRVRKVTTTGLIYTIAGNGTFTYSGDGGPGTQAGLYFPSGVILDSGGNVYVADNQNNTIRKLTPAPDSAIAPVITRVISASGFGSFTTAAPGSWIEIYGSDLAGTSRSWRTNDFRGDAAPTVLDGSTVTIGGKSAFVSYVSAGQINVQVPSDVTLGDQQVIVTTLSGVSAPATIKINATAPGLPASPAFVVNGRQYAAAVLNDGRYALPTGSVAGVNTRPAKPGETVALFGIGFGTVNPNTPAGQIVRQTNSLTGTLRVTFGGVAGAVTYAGLAPGSVGLYQFNVTVPNVPPGDAIPVVITLDGTPIAQTFYVAIQTP